MTLPLDGITVVSLEQAVAAPFATRQLADLGARVIKVERAGGGDFARGYDRTVHGQASYFVWLNRGKESIELDVKSSGGQAVLAALLARADVFVQNLAPGAADRLGLGAEPLRARYPRLICCSVSGYGPDGPYRHKKAYDLLVQCEAGLLSVTGTPDEPAKAGISVADIAAGMYAYSGVLTALYERERTGAGTALEVAMLDALGEWMSQPFYYSVYGGQPARRSGARHASISPYGPYDVSGGQVFLGLQNDREWAVLCERILRRPDLIADARFGTNPDRVANDAELTPIIEDALKSVPADRLAGWLDEAGIANARLRTPQEFAAHPQLAARNRWREVDSPGGPVRALLPPVSVAGREAAMGAVPALGQHTAAILAELGLDESLTQVPTWRKRMTALDTEQPTYTLVIDGQRVEAAAGGRYDTVDPFRGAPWASAADGDAEDVNRAVAAARRALTGPWGQLTGFGRARLLRRLAELIARDADRLAEIETRDTGKLLREMRGQLATIPEWFYYFSGLADKLQGSTVPVDKPNFLVYTRREPAGVVAAIVPWNSPLLLLTWKLAPALAAGCTVVAKPSDYSPASAVELAALMDEAGFPPGVFNVVTGFGPAVGKALAAHPDVDKVAFTGSTAVGAEVAKAAAANITDVLLELGGKSAHVVFDDADLDAACNGVLAGVFAATGQTCMAGSRLLVSRDVHDALVAKIVDRARSIRLGDPRAADTEMGPVATEPQYRKVLSFLDSAANEGATVAAGGRADESLGGFFVQPTVLTGVKPTMTVACEEVFGPVLSVIPFDSEAEAIALANDSRYGLAGAVWTKDIHRGHRVAHALRTGTVWINAYRVVGPDVPFGGFGLSGLGRENGVDAVHEYTQTKAIWVELTGGTRDPFTLG